MDEVFSLEGIDVVTVVKGIIKDAVVGSWVVTTELNKNLDLFYCQEIFNLL